MHVSPHGDVCAQTCEDSPQVESAEPSRVVVSSSTLRPASDRKYTGGGGRIWNAKTSETQQYFTTKRTFLVFSFVRQGIESCGFKSHGGKDAPYVYVDLDGKASWDVFSEILEKAQVCVRV